jgi:Lrp/AsnC family leucine-responsive transcriptional regulator
MQAADNSSVNYPSTVFSFRKMNICRKSVKRKVEKQRSVEKQKTFSPKRGSGSIDYPVNRKLLGLLREDARLTYAELGKRAHLSAPAVYERIRRLERAGVIQKHTVTVDPATIGLPFCAFIRIGTAGDHGCENIVANLAKNPEIEECHSIAGEDTVLIKARTPSAMDLEYLIRRIRSIPGIVTTVTTVVLLTYFERGTQVPLSESDAPQ